VTTPPRAEAAATLDLDAWIAARRSVVEAALDDALPAEAAWPATIHRAVRYSLFAGGKRIRPLLVLAAAEAVGGRVEDALPLACAVEMIHTYSLVHDDLPAMDDDDLRRGKPTSHKVFGEAIAILAGDALLTHAFFLMTENAPDDTEDAVRRRLLVTSTLAVAAGTTGLIGGQVEDLESEGHTIGAAALERLHRAKTGALLNACVQGGGILAGGNGSDISRLLSYGAAIGLAFQVVDDVLDGTSDAQALGKTAGKDAAAGKATYVSVHGLERARAIADGLLAEALAAVRPLGDRGRVLAGLAEMIVRRRA
jgi:geranylgeranyl diphosphate synthase type II